MDSPTPAPVAAGLRMAAAAPGAVVGWGVFNSKRQRRRTASMLFLILAAGLLVWGSVVFHVQPTTGPGRAFWGTCAAMAIAAVTGAAWETVISLGAIRSRRATAHARLQGLLEGHSEGAARR